MHKCARIITKGAILVLERTLSLSSDQCSKILSASKDFFPTHRVQLDTVVDKIIVKKLTNDVKHVEIGSNRGALFLFASIECIMKEQ